MSGPRVAHVIAEFSAREAMGRTVTETARRVSGTHHLVTAVAHDGHDAFADVHELGGSSAVFPLGRLGALEEALTRIRPDVVHLHSGALGALLAATGPLRRRRTVLTMYAWPTLPGPAAWRRATLEELRASNVLAARVVLTTALAPALARLALRAARVGTVLTPDPRVLARLAGGRGPRVAGGRGPRVEHLPSGAPVDPRRATFTTAQPLIVFAGRSETVRGLDTLLAAFPLVRAQVPGVRLRLLLIPRPELPRILEATSAHGHAEALEVVTDPVPDLLAELAAAQVGCWPFKFDYTTSPPAMAVAEAMGVGLPVVGTEVACVRAVLEGGVNGLVVPPADPGALAGALTRLLLDEVLWHRCADAAVRTAASRLSWDMAAEVTAAAYRDG